MRRKVWIGFGVEVVFLGALWYPSEYRKWVAIFNSILQLPFLLTIFFPHPYLNLSNYWSIDEHMLLLLLRTCL